MDNEVIIDNMKNLGMTEYEVKAYLSLLKEYPVNGYALSKNSGIPRSRIYEVLNSLKDKQIVFEQKEGKSVSYYPLEPKSLLEKYKKKFHNMMDNIEEYTKEVYTKNKDDNRLIIINGREKIIDFINLLISDARKRIALSIWEEEINEISNSLDKAIERGVTVKGIYLGANNRYKQLVTHRRIDRYLAEKKERYMTITVDSTHVVFGILSRGEDSKVTWAKDSGFVEMSEDYISHDLMVNVYSNNLEEKEKEKFEVFCDEARRDYFDYTDEDFEKIKWKEKKS